MIDAVHYTDKQKYQNIKSYCDKKYENDKFEVSFIKLCLTMLFPECLNYNSDDSIDDAIDGLDRNDLGIDAFLRDDNSKTMIFCQFKTSQNEKMAVDPRDISYFRNLEDRIQNCENHSNKRIMEIIQEYKELRRKDYKCEYYFITSYNLSKSPIEALKGDNYHILTLDDIHDKYQTYISETSDCELDECFVELYSNTNGKDIPYYTFELKRMGTKKTIVSILNGKCIIDIYKKHRKELFERNVRFFLGNRGINKNIISTALKEPECFYYYNNGITITCEKFEKSGRYILKLTKPQIINGAQTVCSIYDAYEQKVKEVGEIDANKHFEKLYILARIIETTKTIGNFAQNVTQYNNTQNKILEQDFYANSRIQRDLHEKLLQKGYFYENKRNEFETLANDDKKKYQDKVIKLGDITPLYCCFKEQNNTTGSNKKNLFEKDKFDEIYSSDCITEKGIASIIFVYNLHKILKDIKRQISDCTKGKNPEPKEEYTLSLDNIVSHSYIDTLKNKMQLDEGAKDKAEKTINMFDAIKQPYVIIAIVSEILKRADIDLTKYYQEKILYNVIQKNWLKNISFTVWDIYKANREMGNNIINYYKSKNLMDDFREYLEEKEIKEDKTVKDLFEFKENIE